MISQVVILAAGKSSRFYPFGELYNKVAPVLLGKPIIVWTLESLRELPLQSVILIISDKDRYLETVVKNYQFPFKLEFAYQSEPKGQGDALLSAKPLLMDQFVMINANHVNAGESLAELNALPDAPMRLCTTLTNTPWMYGIVKTEGDKAIELVEKPQGLQPPAHRIVGVYQLNRPFVEFMASLPAEEYLLETALNQYLKDHPVLVYEPKARTLSLKYAWHLLDLKEALFASSTPYCSPEASIASSAHIEASVIIEAGARILEGACIKGNSYIGKNVLVGNNALIRDSVLEEEVQVGFNSEITRSIMMSGTHSHGGFIGDSIVGQNCHIGAGFITANRRLDRKDIMIYLKDKQMSSGRSFLGTVIGHETKIGIHAGTMPNVMIGNQAVIGPGVIVKKNMESGEVI